MVQTDAPAAGGDSGGPAIDDGGRVVGVMTFVTSGGSEGAQVQGFNFVIPSQAIRDFLTGTDVKLDEPSRFNNAWHAGLRDFFAGRYSSAARSLAEANRLLPELPDVMRIARDTEDKIKNPPPRKLPWMLIGGVLTIVSAGAYGLLFVVGSRRNKFRVEPSELVRMMDQPDPPVILDVRDTDTYARSPVRLPNARHVAPHALESGGDLDITRDRTLVAYCT